MVILLVLLGSLFLNSCSNLERKSIGDACLDTHRVTWDYSKDRGPTKWSELNKDFEICTKGKHQSPINIQPGKIEEIDDYKIKYLTTKIDLIDNEHTIEFDYEKGSSLLLGGRSFQLKQFHFHSPSEHTVDGKRYAMEVHLVHKDKVGKLTVLALLVEEGLSNPLIDDIWAHLPHEKDKHYEFPDERLNIVSLIPKNRKAYYYSGSLTTPPCSESVNWLVLKEPVEFSKNEIDYFHEFYNWNARSPQ